MVQNGIPYVGQHPEVKIVDRNRTYFLTKYYAL
jgi:hypothetical protein